MAMPKKFTCFWNGHDYKLVRDESTHQEKIQCSRCGKTFEVNDREMIEAEWDERLDAVYEQFESSRTKYFDMLAGRH